MEYWIQITSGQGPAECEELVVRLTDHLLRQAAASGVAATAIDLVPGTEKDTARSILLSVTMAPGQSPELLCREGTVQWTCPSRFRPRHPRKNWFAGITILTVPEATAFDAGQIKVDTLRASGPGGQHVNTSNTAVRVTHLPTGLTATAQEERSQLRNKQLALSRLHAQLQERQQAAMDDGRRQLWDQHHHLVRGNPVMVFRGPRFELTKP